jgi:hypothetical protein
MMKYLLIAILAFGSLHFAFAQDEDKNPLLTDQFYLEAGVFIPSKNINLGADGSTPNDEIDFGETFNFNDNQATMFLNLEWRWNKKWRLTGEYFAVNNARRVELEEDIEFEDIIFEKGTFVRGGIDFKLYRIFVGRIISTGQKHSLGGGLGIHAMDVGAFIEGELKTNVDDIAFEKEKRDVSVLLPLPNIGAWYHYAPTKKWAFTTRLDWFGISIDNYSGGLWNIAPGIKYQIIKNLGIGLDYRFFFLNARVSETNWKGKFDMDYTGPLFTLHGNF